MNIELPWNPVRLEQRVGRVDRIGQGRTVHAVHLVANATFETELMARLAARVGRARAALGSIGSPLGPLDDMVIADAVIRGTDLPPAEAEMEQPAACAEATILVPHLIEDAKAECVRAAQSRDWRRAASSRLLRERGAANSAAADWADRRRGGTRHLAALGPGAGRWEANGTAAACVIPRRRLLRVMRRHGRLQIGVTELAAAASVLCVFVARYVDRGGRLVEQSLIPLAGRGRLPLPRARADQRKAIEAILGTHGPALRACAGMAARRRVSGLGAARLASAEGPRRREQALVESLRQSSSLSGPQQVGLFDRRALRRMAAQDSATELRRQVSRHRLGALEDASSVSLAADPELALLLLVSD